MFTYFSIYYTRLKVVSEYRINLSISHKGTFQSTGIFSSRYILLKFNESVTRGIRKFLFFQKDRSF